jgi:hypothetical protein
MNDRPAQRPQLDGRPFPGVMAYTYREHQADFVAAGIEVFRLSLPVGWVGPGRYDFTEGDEVAAAFCAAHDKVRLFPLLWLDGPETKWWELEHPGELAVALDRKTGVVRREHPSVPSYAEPGMDLAPGGDLFNRHHQGSRIDFTRACATRAPRRSGPCGRVGCRMRGWRARACRN